MFQIIAPFPCPVVHHDGKYSPIMLFLPYGSRTLNIMDLLQLFCECT